MPRDSQGNTQPLPGSIVSEGDTVLPSQHNPPLVDLYAMMSQSLSRDGQGGMRAPLNLNGFQIQNLGPSEGPGSAASVSQVQSAMPLGTVVDSALPNAPAGWMFAYGQAISVEAYPEYVSAAFVGTALNATAGYGYRTTSQIDPSNNRSATGQYIVLPDCRGRVSAGRDNMGGADAQRLNFFGAAATLIGGVMGAASHILTLGQMPKHAHTGSTGQGGAHDHDYVETITPGADGQGGWRGNSRSSKTSMAPNHTHPIPEQGNDEAHTNTQPTIIFNKIIKVAY